MKTVVVYYSMGGNTDFAAREVARRLGASILRLEPEKAYPDKGFRKFFWGGKSAVMAETPRLKPYTFDVEGATDVILGFPVWAGNVAPPLRTFVRDNLPKLQGLRLHAFACQSGAGAEKAFDRLQACLGGRALGEKLVLIDPKDKPSPENQQKIEAFCAAVAAGG